MEIKNKETIVERPNMKGRILARLNREVRRIQDKIGKLKTEVEFYEATLKDVLQEKDWVEKNLGEIK